MEFTVTKIPKELHLLPGIGGLEYVYNGEVPELAINIDGREVFVYHGEAARAVQKQVATAGGFMETDERKIRDMLQKAFKVSIEEISERTRKRKVVQLRQIGMWWLKNYTRMPLRQIGSLFGGFDHTTVLYASKTVENLKETNEEFRAMTSHFLAFAQEENEDVTT